MNYNGSPPPNTFQRNSCRVRKSVPAGYERFFTLGEDSMHVIECALGRLAVLICYENTFPHLLRRLSRMNIDLLVQPFCAPGPPDLQMALPWTEESSRAYTKSMFLLRSLGACLGIPAALVNKAGRGCEVKEVCS